MSSPFSDYCSGLEKPIHVFSFAEWFSKIRIYKTTCVINLSKEIQILVIKRVNEFLLQKLQSVPQ